MALWVHWPTYRDIYVYALSHCSCWVSIVPYCWYLIDPISQRKTSISQQLDFLVTVTMTLKFYILHARILFKTLKWNYCVEHCFLKARQIKLMLVCWIYLYIFAILVTTVYPLTFDCQLIKVHLFFSDISVVLTARASFDFI